MMERLAFIATLYFFISIGIGAFLIMGNSLYMPNGSSIGLLNSNSSALDYSTIRTQSNDVIFNSNGSEGLSSTAPGQAEGLTAFTYNSNPAGFLGLNWITQGVAGVELVGLKLVGIYAFAAPIIMIFVIIGFALKGFFFMYWGMAGARAIFGRFL